MDVITLDAEARGVGKSAARAARRQGLVPCVLYGHHVEPVAFQVPENALHKLIYTTEAHLVRVNLDKDSWECILKDIDFHPMSERPVHADFQVLQKGEKVTMMVPIQFHGTPVGQTDGGDLQYVLHELEVNCLPEHIPSHIDVDIAALRIGDSIHISDLSTEGIEFLGQPQQAVVTVLAPRVHVEEGEVAAPVEEGEAEEETEEEGEA
jgi:large subunit ribosomal protein L25